MRPVLVGEAPSRTGAALPVLDSSRGSGRRLAELAGVDRLADAFEVRNLIDRWPGASGKASRFDPAAARLAADLALPDLAGRLLVLLGKRVAGAFRIPRPIFLEALYLSTLPAIPTLFRDVPALVACHRASAPAATFVILPHPSGVNRWWNDAGNVDRAGRFLRELLEAYPA